MTEQQVFCCRARHYLLGPDALTPNCYDRHILTVGFAYSFPIRENGTGVHLVVRLYKKNYMIQVGIKLIKCYEDDFSTVHTSLCAC